MGQRRLVTGLPACYTEPKYTVPPNAFASEQQIDGGPVQTVWEMVTMLKHRILSTILFAVFAIGILTTQVGCNKEQRNAGADATIAFGGALVVLPHPAAKIAGVTLITAGASAKIVIAFVEGPPVEQAISLEDAEKAKKAGVEIQFQDGKKERTKVNTGN